MCGIVGYIGRQPAKDILLTGLKRLEYRGYDSAGIAIIHNSQLPASNSQRKSKLISLKAVGKVAELEEKLKSKNFSGTGGLPAVATALQAGIAHTRWATHGKPSEKNAHPHMDCTGAVALVHNGIIENYSLLKEELVKQGHRFRSQTDSEVAAHLIEEAMKKVSFEEAFLKTLKRLKGTYGIVALSAMEPGKMLVARLGSPLVIGVGRGEYFVASDVSAMLRYTQQVVYLEDGEVGVITEAGHVIKTLDNRHRTKETVAIEWSDEEAQKGGFAHFMLKEIFDQPESFADAIRGRLLTSEGMAKLGGLESVEKRLREIERLIIVSCGTSYHSGLIGEYMLEEYAGIPVEVEFASEFRYRKPLLNTKTAVLAISQSGETADTLAAIREAKRKGALTLGIVNVVGSTIARETDAGVYNHAGPEVSVASTKAFTSQLAILSLLTLYLGRERGMSLVTGQRIARELEKIPRLMQSVLNQASTIKKLAKKYVKQKHFLYLGRKYEYPIALEGALKVKEIAYVGAQGYPTGEMKHGPIALISPESLCVMLAPQDSVYEKNASGLEEIKARNGKTLVITTAGNKALMKKADAVIFIPKTPEILTPLLSIIPLQLFAYYMSVAQGHDVDKPRNLAKSVTVE